MSTPYPQNNHRLLLVDDNKAIHDDIKKILAAKPSKSTLDTLEIDLFGDDNEIIEQTHFDIDSAYQGQEALELVQASLRSGNRYSVAFVDMRMPPGWDGIETIEHLWRADPDLQIVICSAYSDHSWSDIKSRLGKTDQLLVLKKPFDNIEIVQMTHALSQKWALQRELLQTSEKRYRALYDANPAMCFTLDSNGTILSVNRFGAEKLGFDAAELVDTSVFALHPDDEKAMVRENLETSFRESWNVHQWETYKLSKQGSQLLVWETARVVEEMDGHPTTLLVCEDITERRRAEEALRESEERLRSITESASEGIVSAGHDGNIVSWNRGAQVIFGYQADEIIGQPVTKLMPKRYRPAHENGLKRWYKTGESTVLGKTIELAGLRKDGNEFPLEISLAGWNSGKGKFVSSIIRDITERKRAEHALQASEKRFRALYDDNPAMFFTLDSKGIVLSVNHFGAEQLGYSVEELINRSAFLLYEEGQQGLVRECLDKCIEMSDQVHRWEVCKVHKDGTRLWVRETARVVEGENGQSTMLLVCEDITEAHNLANQLSYQATHDVLTDLVNRYEFERRLQRAAQTAQTEKREHALCYLDLDQFKVMNDTCGHVAGDELLRQIATLLGERIRKRDTLARLGGDEFGVLLEDCSIEQAMRIASGLRRAVEDFRFLWEDKSFSLGVSIGLIAITDASEGIAALLSAADTACYAAKDQGRNRIHVYHDNDVELSRRTTEMQWVARIHRALEEKRFHLCAQPIVRIGNNYDAKEHYELLLRMEDENGNIVTPGAFLPAAERYNLATKLDRWVISTAFEWFIMHPEQLDRLFLCSINLSGHSLVDGEFLDFLSTKLEEGHVPPEKICFEITETAAISNLSSATHFIKALNALGCRFALDDFGSGLSSFAYLKNLPVDFLKIDGLFVKDIVDDPVDFAMVKSINDMGHVLGKQTIAEFVENDDILKKLQQIGVDYAQGYGVGKPRPLAERTLPARKARSAS